MLQKTCFLFLLFIQVNLFAQLIDAHDITIVRDSFGVPHIFGITDADAAYGLAWAHCEDNFHDIQINAIGGRGRRGELEGKDGVIFDFALHFLGIDTIVNNRYETDFSPSFKKVVDAYVQGVNDYAYLHQDQLLLKNLLPFTKYDMIKGYCITSSLMAGVGYSIKAIRSGHLNEYIEPNDKGSNSICIAPSRTEDHKAWLLVNSHQPLEGPYAWYEAHICSEEGWNVIGGLFPGGLSIFVGANQHLGWAHTNNYHTFGDIYILNVKKKSYLYDNVYKPLIFDHFKLKVKLGSIILSINKKLAYCDYGPVYKYKGVYYAIRFPAYTNIKAAEQWFNMNKSKNLDEFESCMKQDNLTMFNTLYADIEGNIYYHSAGMMPLRDPNLKWNNPIEGTSSKYKWTSLVSYENKVTYKNPSCGFLYNANNTPLHASGIDCNWKGTYYPGLQIFEYNRGERLAKLFNQLEGSKITWNDFTRIKFDKNFDSTGSYSNRFENLYQLNPLKYPRIADAIQVLKNWNLDNDVHNTSAALALVTHYYVMQKTKVPFGFLMIRKNKITEEEARWSLTKARNFLLHTHHLLTPELGDVLRHTRGNVNIPASGAREVLRAADAKLLDKKNGLFRVVGGDGYIQMDKFSKENGVEIQSIIAYGSSSRPDSKHYTDQMNLFQNQQFKTMTFDKNEIFKHAEKIYHPKE
ncbi:MAG: penicillin acylase family protein [Bacteroidota bacterium]